MMLNCDSTMFDCLIQDGAVYHTHLDNGSDTLVAATRFGYVDATHLNREAIRRGYKTFIEWMRTSGLIRFEEGNVARCPHCRQLLPVGT